SRIFKASAPYGAGGLTLTLIAFSVLATGLAWAEGDNKNIFRTLLISESLRGLPEVAKGEIWRLITPIFLHGGPRAGQFGILHLFFNMWWLMDLGSMIEARKSSRYLLGQVLLIALLSNLAQWYWGGPNFVGMSGVVYGLLGYVWMKGHFDPFSGFYLHRQTVLVMLIWFFACWFRLIPNVANYAHAGGLVAGMALGIGSSFLARRNR
ncbi:MAG: rhomboid family intramembrane serine protease, partial [Verrucomicrobia subdivision 3 bacterium]|nr:rhomboid family intramembrane serine protease [Limisphaerales bacterium]